MATTTPINSTPRRRGGGPKTEAGKRRSSMNAVKHGLYSAAVVLPGESMEEYEALLARYLDRFRPTSPDEEHLVHTLVNAEWRIRRLIHIQTARLADIIRRQSNEDRDPIAHAYTYDLVQTQTIATADKHEARLQREYDRALRRLLDAEKRRAAASGSPAQNQNTRNELAATQTSESGNVPAPAPAAAPQQNHDRTEQYVALPPAATVETARSWENRVAPPPHRLPICSIASPCTEHGSTI